MYFNSKGKDEVTYDAIVVGTGISGGWAAKELAELGLKILVLERGRMVKHGDYPTANLDPWEMPNGGKLTPKELEEVYPKQGRTGYTVSEATKHWWPKDNDHPYTEEKPFDWIRGYHVGGRSLLWGRQTYRLSDLDFMANAKEGIAVDWPIRYADISPWYDKVETFIGVSGENAGLPQLPDGKFQKPMDLNCIEKKFRSGIESNFPERNLLIGRAANLTEPIGTRGTCQTRNRCIRGCPFGAYFSSNSSTLPAAEATGNMTLRPNSIVSEVVYDPKTQKASGVRIIDAETGDTHEFFSKIVFLNASTVGSTSIMLRSKSERFPDGFGNDSGELGHNLMDHHYRAGASSETDDFQDQTHIGGRPNGIYIPRFQNINAATKRKDYLRGFGYQGGGGRRGWSRSIAEANFGANFKEEVMTPGNWSIGIMAFGETLPYHDNKLYLNEDLKDIHGMSTVVFDAEFKENEMKMRVEMQSAAAEMMEAAGFKNVSTYNKTVNPGNGIHEMGTARMGRDPKTSVLNKWNQVHAAKNVFVTDGSAMTSAGCQNPSLTYMALTARAANYAAEQLKKGNL